MDTKIKNASVKVMLSYDYSHFECSMSVENDEGLSLKDIDEARKNCQRLANKAVGQYQTAKSMAAKRTNGEFEMSNFESQCKKIEQKEEHDRTLKEIAMLKQYQDETWRNNYLYSYDYEDDEQYGY